MLEAPWALLALLSLPILIWIHRRRQQGVPVDVPSLLFLEPEDAQAIAPDRRRFDAELALTLLAATCLALAAAGPRVAVGAPAPKVRVVLDASPAMEAKATPTSKSPREQAEAALAALGLQGSVVHARGKPSELVAAARREPADVRIIVSDRAITPAPPDVHVAAYGDPAAENAGIVGLHVEPLSPGWRVFATLMQRPARGATVRLDAHRMHNLPEVAAAFAETEFATVRLDTPALEGDWLSLMVSTGIQRGDSLGADDIVDLWRGPLHVAFSDAALPAEHRKAVLDVLEAVLGPGGVALDAKGPQLVIGPVEAPDEAKYPEVVHDPDYRFLRVVLNPLRHGYEGTAVSTKSDDDLDPVLAGVDAAGSTPRGPAGSMGGPGRPLVRRIGSKPPVYGTYEWVADPLAGSPAPVDTPAWPIFWANVVATIRGDDVGAGWRATGVLDPNVTRLGRDRIPIDPAWIAEAKPAAPEPKDLRPPLIAGGVLCLLLLWFAPRGRRVATVG